MSDEVKPKMEISNNQRHKKNRNEEWLAPTSNLEKVTFNHEAGMKPGEFKTRVNHLDKYMVNLLKHFGPQLSKAYKSRDKPTITFLNKLNGEESEDPGAIKDYNRAYDKSAQSEDNW